MTTTSTVNLNDLLHLDLKKTKVSLNMYNGDEDPLDVYLENPDIFNHGWLLHKNEAGDEEYPVGTTVVGLVRLKNNPDLWLLTTVAKITASSPAHNAIGYTSEDLSKYAAYYGRVIVKFHNNALQTRRWAETIMQDLIVDQILPETLRTDIFPGYDHVCLTYAQLKSIVTHQPQDWVAALSHQKAVYLLTDKSNGKLYVGSATAKNGMLLSRWTDYVNTGHGGNQSLKALDFDHIKENFQYTILENYNSQIDDSVILERESWWKQVLQSKEFGYNQN